MAWRISYWDKKGNLVVHDGFSSEEAAKKYGAKDAVAGLVDYADNFGVLVDEYEPAIDFAGVEIKQ